MTNVPARSRRKHVFFFFILPLKRGLLQGLACSVCLSYFAAAMLCYAMLVHPFIDRIGVGALIFLLSSKSGSL